MEENTKICSRCLYDNSIPEIRFDENGVCQFCEIHDEMEKQYPLDGSEKIRLEKIINKIKKNGKGNRYDCVVGTSGGTDSTYTLLLAKKFGLRALAVHFDNGWNSEIAVNNIKKTTDKLCIDLETWVADWEEFKDLQISFLKASVTDAEVPTDVTIHAVLHKVAAKENIKYIILGHSFRTEGIVPKTWTYMDSKYIKSVHRLFGKKKITSFPHITLWNVFYYSFIRNIKVIPILNYVDYDKGKASEILKKELEWVNYGGHHHESVYTIFFQSFLLPKKFNIDKRILSLSASIRSGAITREEALNKIKNSSYPLNQEIVDYTIKKLGLTKEEFDDIMNSKPKSFMDYPTYFPLLMLLKPLFVIGFRLNLVPKIIYYKYFY